MSFFGSLGVESLVVRDLVVGERDQRKVLSTYFFMRLAGSTLVPLFAVAYLMVVHPGDRLLYVLVALCSGAIVFGAYDAADCWLQARNEAKTTSVIRLAGFFLGALFRCFLIVYNFNVVWFAAVTVVESALIAWLYHRMLSRHGLRPSPKYVSMDEFKHLVIGGKMMVLSGFANTVLSKLDVLIVGSLLPRETVGPYAIAVSMCAAWNMVGMSVAQAWAPRISRARVTGGVDYVRELRHLLQVMLGISVVGCYILTLGSPIIFEILLGPEYAAGESIFSWLIWSAVPVFVGIATSQIIVNERTYWVSMLRTVVATLATLILLSSAINYYGTFGAACVVIFSAYLNVCLILVSKRSRQVIHSVIFNHPLHVSS
jgi:O-antigen/teichoic acid export membrane protein